jgi:hypothetical protein
MPNTFFFKNLTKPIFGGGVPLFPHEYGVAFCNSDYFFAFPLTRGGMSYWEYSPGASSDKTRDWVGVRFGDSQPRESEYVPGTVYKRIYNPPVCGSFLRAIDQGKRTQSFVALRILLDKLATVFQTIEPANANRATFGHLVRELLLIACMEVEASWTAVLRENGYPGCRFTTTDYVKLLEPMLLDGYRLSLSHHPDFPPFSPFDGWDRAAATRSLPWYDSYNKTKHDRETKLSCASLENAVMAVGAAVVMFYAQFGYEVEPSLGEQPTLLIKSAFSLETDFTRYEHTIYIPELTVPPNSPSPVPSFDWRLIDYPF